MTDVPLIPRAHLFGNPTRASAQISPDGKHLAWLAPVGGVLNVWVGSTDAPDDARPITDDRKRGIRNYGWTYDGQHLVYTQDADGDENDHVYAVDPDTCVARDLTPFEGVRASLGGGSRIIRDRAMVGLNRRDPKFVDLYTLHLTTGELTPVEENTQGFATFTADEHFRVHFALRIGSGGSREVLRRAPDGSWSDWITFDAQDARNSGPTNLNRDGTALFLRDSRGRDTAALMRVDLATGDARVLAADPRADIGSTISDPETGELLAYSVSWQRVEYVALDARIQPDIDFLQAQSIGDWYINNRTEDGRLWVLSGVSDTKPGAAYLYDSHAKSLRKLYDSRPELIGAPLVPMRPVVIRSRDGLDLVSYLTRPAGADAPGPMVLLVHGGPWTRDGFGFNSYHQWLANRGYNVLSVNFRGSTGFGKAFVNAGDHEWGRRMDDDLLDAVAWAVAEGVADPAHVAIMGGSYGGYAVLAGMTRNPETYACGVDIVGPSNLETLIATIPPYWEAVRVELMKSPSRRGPSTPRSTALRASAGAAGPARFDGAG